MNTPEATAGVLVPPRPNLGPEPMEPASSTEWWVGGLLIILCLLAVLPKTFALLRRRLAARRNAHPRTTEPRTSRPGPEVAARARMLWYSTVVREELARRFGESWSAKTTEEIAARSELEAQLGPEQAARLVDFLQAADRAKFRAAEESSTEAHGVAVDAWESWVFDFLAGGASSIKTGK
jgi:hypothetical protein